MTQWRLLLSVLTLTMLAATGCKQSHGHDHDDHGHDDDGSHDDHGHGHEELGAISITVWAKKTELFMEYEPLIVGHESRFAAHLTTLSDFKAATKGVLKLVLSCEKGAKLTASADGPASPGIFRFTVTPQQAGSCNMSLSYDGQGITDSIDAGPATIYPTHDEAKQAAPDDPGDGIAYTKEHQWQTEFATVAAGKRKLVASIRAAGEIQPVAGAEARVAAPARGRVVLPAKPLTLGSSVEKGQLLATLSPYLAEGNDPSSLRADSRSAEAELTSAKAERARLERLQKEGAVPERRVAEARARVEIAEAKLAGAMGRLRQYDHGASGVSTGGPGAFQLRSAIAGSLVQAKATTGDSVEEGDLLFVVIDMSSVWLTARVFEPDIPKVEAAKSAWFTIEGYDQEFTIDEANGKLVTVGRVIDPKTRTVPVVFELENPDEKIRIGQFARVYVAAGEEREVLAVPSSAILTEGAKQVVYVQTEGETFERRVVKPGSVAKGFTEVKSGVEAGERVVSVGAYEVRLAAASGAIPEHGHVH